MALPYTLTCETGFQVAGMQEGENYLTPVRVLTTVFSVTVVSAWCNRAKIKKLSLFFSHWLSGAVLGLSYLTEDVMVSSCYAASNLLGLIKFIKFLELAASNMLAATNLGICINLALIVSSHRTMTRVKTVSSPGLLFLLLLVSVALSAATVPLWETALVLGTGFWFTNPDPEKYDLAVISIYVIEFFVGICMLGIVSWLLMFRMKEIKECWEAYARIRYYFCLTLFGTAVNLGLGICGVVFVVGDRQDTSCQSERELSGLGFVCNNLRQSMMPDRVQMVMFLRSNPHFIPEIMKLDMKLGKMLAAQSVGKAKAASVQAARAGEQQVVVDVESD